MKRILLQTVGALLFLNAYAGLSGILPVSLPQNQNQINGQPVLDSVSINEDKRFAGWSDEQYQIYEDSICTALYSPVIAQKTERPSFDGPEDSDEPLPNNPSFLSNTHVPNSVTLDTKKAIGQIVIHSGTSSTGARTYSVPIDVYPGMRGFEPKLSLSYNSQQGNGVAGVGWSVSGISVISRSGKSVYYDGKSQGVLMNKDDAFVLNGIRLIKLSETTSNIIYESEQGNIKAKAYISGNIVKYFEVFYPEGNKAVFGYTTNSTNYLFYPMISMTDPKGNKIDYSYTYSGNHYRISKISYNGASVEFQYQLSRPDTVIFYSGGLKVAEPNLLQNVICKYGSTVLGSFGLSYTTRNGISLLTQISYTASGSSYNPLYFYYGEGVTASSYTKSETQLLEWYKADDPSMIKVAKGKFDYDSGADGLISLPNLNPYWKHYRHSTAFRHSQNRFDNKYTGDEKIFLYAGLQGSMADPMPNLTTGTGFVDIICADIEGKQEECVIKINDQVVNDNDQVTFNVYRSHILSGLAKLYTRTYNFPTVYTDADKGKSIQPKFYFSGDFNGDGKMEVLAVSVHQPFGDTGKPSKCYIFDLVGNKILYQNHVFPYNVDFVGTQQSDPKAAANNTDKLFVMDYDGDGKSDICHINENGTNIYTFDVSGSIMTARKVATYTGLKKADLANRDVLLGELNGDGLMDLLVSPSSENGGGYTWTVYNSKGDGLFDKSTFSGTFKSSADNSGFIMQDINSDGMTDLLKYDTSGFFTYLAKNNNVGSSTNYSSFPSTKSILIPTNINAHSYFSQLISLKEGKATKYSFQRNDSKEVLATGMANSLGVIEKNNYELINAEGKTSGIYMKGTGAVYPYVNLYEPIPVLASSETFMNGKQIDQNRFTYYNAVIHRQGLGFRGFETITRYNNRGQSLVQNYEPYRYSVLKSEESPEFKKMYNYAVNVQSNKIVKILLTSRKEEDLLKKTSANTSFIYDTYGYPTQQTTTYTGNISVKKTNTYWANTIVGDGYSLGYLTDQIVVVTRDGSTYTERMSIPSHSVVGFPNVEVYYIDGNRVKEISYVYDTKGNVITEDCQLFASKDLHRTSYSYDSYGRLLKVTNPLGLTNEYTYNTTGRVATIKDDKGGITSYIYDPFGREQSATLPDKTVQTTSYAWSTEGTNGLYAITKSHTGQPTTKSVYDALNREVRSSSTRFNGTLINTDKQYDSYGNIQKVSLPFPSSSPSLWNTYSYDSYNRLTNIIEASGRKTTYSYNANSITTVEDKVSVTRNYDVQSNLISVTDPAGTITYNLCADGQPSSIVAPGNVTTSFGYDKYRRRTSISDPSFGMTSYEYDASGNVTKETNANAKITQYAYDSYNRIKSVTTPEFVTTYTYNTKDELASISTNNGTSKTFTYDAIGRLTSLKENAVDSKWLQKDYTYSNGNISSVKYTSQSGVLATENYIYSNGYLSEMKLNGQTTIYKLSQESSFGHPTELLTGGITQKFGYTSYGLPSSIASTGFSKNYQNFVYTFDATNNNLSNRKDNIRNITENFGYDNLNRLTSYSGNTMTYDAKGNITKKSDVGSFEYTNTQKPYAVSGATLLGNGIPARAQTITYNSFWRPNSISENGYVATFTYNGEYERVKMNLTKNGIRELTRYYLGGCYELDQASSSTKEKLYLFGDYYNAAAVYVKNGSSGSIYYILRDYLGSITQVVASDGTLTQELSYDAWGRLRNPANQTIYISGQEPVLFLGRGYSGHEYLPQFGLINMNARLYDPALGRFLSPDPFVQAPDFSQNFNRYVYGMNNPLRYVDPDGEFIHIVIGAIVGGAANLIYKAISGQLHSFKDGFAAFGIGAVAGGLGAATGGAIFAAAGGAAGGIGGFLAGAAGGAATSATMMPIQSAGNSMYFGDPFMTLDEYVIGIATAAITGGAMNGTYAAIEGRNFWTGDMIKSGRGMFSFNNTPIQKAPQMEMLDAPKPALEVQKPTLPQEGFEIPDQTIEKFQRHFNAKNRHADLNLSVDKMTENVKNVIMENQQFLQQGDNTLVGKINGIDKSIKVNIENTTIRSINLYPGVSNRGLTGGKQVLQNPRINFGSKKWK
ncbi:RHS repeat-associated core domain-containing protein [Phocaeicola massiliensis]|uniref:RHS repeat-associated core domain-containing protein n=1 Tax=Phocaeicola massiliensis TaxID=204516 RepID=UPI0032C13CA0